MTTTDWLIDIALLLVVLRQMREERLTARTILLPLGMIAWSAGNYLTDIPTAGNDVLQAVVFAATGVVFGLAGGLLHRVRHACGHALIKASRGAAALWIISMGFRLGFAVWSTYPNGAARRLLRNAAERPQPGTAAHHRAGSACAYSLGEADSPSTRPQVSSVVGHGASRIPPAGEPLTGHTDFVNGVAFSPKGHCSPPTAMT